jgi:hypothetical protein
MKTITITFHHTTNYGATFQTYALHSYIRGLGHENKVIETSTLNHYYNTMEAHGLRPLLICAYVNFFKFLRRREGKKLIADFKRFKESHIEFTKCYNSYEELKKDNIEADCLITGSDQVWNIHTTPEYVKARFLDFGKKNAIRFSYAASIRVMDYTDEQKEYIESQLNTYKGISVREESANTYLRSFINRDIDTVVDPVFLKSRKEWIEVSKSARLKNVDYILCYQVVSNDRMQRVVDELKLKTGFKVVSICCDSIKWIKSDYTFYDVSPEEMLGFFNDAKMVVTTSFHGTAFSIIFNKPVFSLVKSYSANRITDLMGVCGLDDFVIDEKKALPEFSSVNWNDVNSRLNKEISKSKQFLNKMLNEE